MKVKALVVAACVLACVTLGAQGKKKGHRAVVAGNDLAVVLAQDNDGDGVISYGDAINFDITAPEGWNEVEVICTQDEVVVYGAIQLPYYAPDLALGSRMWTGGAASCTAHLLQFHGDTDTTLALLDFEVVD